MKTCNFEGCTAPESQLMPCLCIGGIVYSCKFHLFVLKIVLGDKLLLDEGVIRSYYRSSGHPGIEYGVQEENKCEKEEKVKETEV